MAKKEKNAEKVRWVQAKKKEVENDSSIGSSRRGGGGRGEGEERGERGEEEGRGEWVRGEGVKRKRQGRNGDMWKKMTSRKRH